MTASPTGEPKTIRIVCCERRQHAAAVLAILNEAIANSTAIYDYKPRSRAQMKDWFAAKASAAYPVLGAVDGAGGLLGFATYGAFRNWPAYKYTVEHSVYVEHTQRGQGIGRILLARLIEHARRDARHVMVGGIDATNEASLALHRAFGFKHAGTIHQAGFKFGRWLDLTFYQLILDSPANPTDG